MRAAVRSRLGSAGDWLRRALLEADCPLTCVEVRARAIGVVRFRRERRRLRLEAAASLDLPEGVLRPALAEPNIVDAAAVRQTLAAALDRVGPPPGGRIALVLPDLVARLRVFEASEVGGRGSRQTDELIRFRLKRTLPFEIRDAHVSRTSGVGAGLDRILVAAAFRPVLAGYEEAIESLGLHAGLVDLAGPALLQVVPEGPGDRLLVNWDEGYVSFLVARQGVPLLVRTLSQEAAASAGDVLREAASTALYHQERLGSAGLAGAWVRCTVLPPTEAAGLVGDSLGVATASLDLPTGGASGAPRLVPHELAAGAACVMARAA